MDIYKKLVQTITPPPRDRSPDPKIDSKFDSSVTSISRIHELTGRLLDPNAAAELRQLAREGDSYRIAMKVESSLRAIRPSRRRDTYYLRCVGFELVGDLYLKHLRQSVNGLEAAPKSIGPNVFRDYCSETIDAYFAGDHVKACIESMVVLADSCLFRAIHSQQAHGIYLALAEQAIESIAGAAENRVSRESRETNRDYRGNPRKESSRKSKRMSSSLIGEDLDAYLQTLRRRYVRIVSEIRSNASPPPHTLEALREDRDPVKIREQLAYFEQLLNLNSRKSYLPFSAAIKTHVAFLRERWKRGGGQAFFRTAAREYELQAETEKELQLSKLCKARMAEARTLYLRAGMKTDAARIENSV
jgi:hypothetical protein